MTKKEEELLTVSYPTLLTNFKRINSESLAIISNWRLNHGRTLDKINVNGAHDVVTEVDIAIEELTRQTIEKSTLGIKVFGEENFKQEFDSTEEPLFVVVDPIDGTKEFIKGTQDWSISICAVENGLPVVASVFLPDKDELYTCIKGSGVYLNDKPLILSANRGNNMIGVSPRQIQEEAFRSKIVKAGFKPSHISALTPKICSILRGDIDVAVYFEQNGVSATLWDYAAVHLLIHESGGRMTSLYGSELPFSGKEVIHTKGWLATSSKIDHGELLTCLGNR
ncbi:inositol monophosphatase family protein [Patescibacteria group bacterium]|nr:inositol monophosphatase family protein [Patescibacteria group bacterium]